METIQIQIVDEAETRPGGAPPTFSLGSFGGIVPQRGDLIALPLGPTSPDNREPTSSSAGVRRVIERYFWPVNGDRLETVRISLLVQPLQAASPEDRQEPPVAIEETVLRTTRADIPFIIQQIYSCLHLARDCGDSELAAALRKVAVAYANKAISLGADPKTLPGIF